MKKEQWYQPVDMGIHIDPDSVEEETLDKCQSEELFHKETVLSAEALAEFEALRDAWVRDNGEQYQQRFADNRAFIPDEERAVSVQVSAFSAASVTVYVVFVYGHARWHHYYLALKKYTAARNDHVDDALGLKELEANYSFSFKGIGHGTAEADVIKILGEEFCEYAGQSPLYRQLYFENHDLEAVIQDGSVKYLQLGRPGWMDAAMQ